jgi:hypothetical protein
MCFPGGGGGGGGAATITIPKAKKTEKDAFGYASAYDPILADYLGYDVQQGGRSAPIQSQLDDLTAQMAATTDKGELKLLKKQAKDLKGQLKDIKKDAGSDFTLSKRAPTRRGAAAAGFSEEADGHLSGRALERQHLARGARQAGPVLQHRAGFVAKADRQDGDADGGAPRLELNRHARGGPLSPRHRREQPPTSTRRGRRGISGYARAT